MWLSSSDVRIRWRAASSSGRIGIIFPIQAHSGLIGTRLHGLSAPGLP
jgi:hypothetical protein